MKTRLGSSVSNSTLRFRGLSSKVFRLGRPLVELEHPLQKKNGFKKAFGPRNFVKSLKQKRLGKKILSSKSL